MKESAEVQRTIGDCLSHLGRDKEAIGAYRKAVELSPEDPESRYWYANSLIGVQQGEALKQFRKLVALEPGAARGFIGLANVLYNLDRFPEAIAAFDTAKQLCPTCLD